MPYILLVISILLGTAKSALSKNLGKLSDNVNSFAFANLLIFTVAAVPITFGVLASPSGFSTYTIIMSFFFGITTFFAQYFYIKALYLGTMSFATMIYSCGFFIPTVFGTLYYKEDFKPLCALGIVLLLISILLFVYKSESENLNLKGLCCSFVASAMSGGVGIVQKLHQHSQYKQQQNELLFSGFSVCILLCIILFLSTIKNREKKKATDIIFASLCGISVGFANKINLYLAGMLASYIFFPVLNGSVVVASGFTAKLIYKEKLSKRELLGIILGIIAIALVAVK